MTYGHVSLPGLRTTCRLGLLPGTLGSLAHAQ
jgi:hypothetical protein